ncbi:MAG: hypothetical protein KJ593_08085 [Candidatus Omnitrophica bacterium]|nr:hypothetical protein [Candidatus Omnitrophota bacterium]
MNLLFLNLTISLSLTFLTTFIIGLFVFLKDRKNAVNRTFALYSLSIAFWSILEVFLISAHHKDFALHVARIEKVGIFFIPTFFLHFIISFLKIKKSKLVLIFSYLISLIFTGICNSNLLIADVVPKFYVKYQVIPGPAYIYVLLFFTSIVVYCLYELFLTLRRSEGIKRSQLNYLFWGSLIGYIGGGANFFHVYNIDIPILNPFGTYAVPVYVFLVSYAIFRHQLLDIRLVLRKGLAYSILLTIITALYLVFILTIGDIFQNLFGYKSFLINLLAIFSFAILFAPLKNAIQSFIDKRFFKGTLASLAEERRRLEEELRRSDHLKAVATLAAGMAHEIKNPLTSIKTFTEYLEENKEKPKFIAKFKKIVGSEVDKINSIVHQLLDFSKPTPLKLKKCNINQILDETLALLSNDLLKHKIRLIKDYRSQEYYIQADSNQLKQAFLNIFLNSIEAMLNGGVLTVSTNQQNSKLAVIIKDTGKGIPEKDLPHIFDPFFTTSDKGTGLGLLITHGIIKEHGGKIEIKSRVVVGSKVKITLKL